MSFENEYVTETDAVKYRLDELKASRDYWGWRNGRPDGYVHTWTVDKERELFLFFVKQLEEVGGSGRPEPTNKFACVIGCNSVTVPLVIERISCPSSSAESPFVITWDLIQIDIPTGSDVSRSAVVAWLKEALTVYGYEGANWQVPNTHVVFKF